MKCPRCASEMKREKIAINKYVYKCPKCHKQIGPNKSVSNSGDDAKSEN